MENINLNKMGMDPNSKLCEHCGSKIAKEAVICVKCGCRLEEEGKPKFNPNSKFCKHCGEQIAKEAVICVKCGCQVEEIIRQEQPRVVINNSNSNINANSNTNVNRVYGRAKNKWVALILCLVFGLIGAHKFYEGKVGMGIVYVFTAGLFGFGWIIDIIVLLTKPTTYYV